MTKIDDLHREWMRKPGYRAAYDALADEFALAEALVDARAHRSLTQEQVAQRMKTSQAAVAHLEGGRGNP